MLGMFDPQDGIDINEFTKYIIQNRFIRGLNNRGSYPLNPNSSICSKILKEIYCVPEKQTKLNHTSFYGMVYYIGTPWIGKSSTFFVIKYLHDIKVRAAIKVNIPSDSIFSVHNKFIYFHSMTKLPQIFKIIQNQLNLDFEMWRN